MMQGHSSIVRSAHGLRLARRAAVLPYVCRQCRAIQISAAPTTDASKVGSDAFGSPEGTRDMAGMDGSVVRICFEANKV